ncbi:MAG: response regulator transcription factor [Armatimonadetes bacterium]|nr:response regulator transcription factor [Armatimonadota bacterium]
MEKIRVLIAEDQAMVRHMLARLLGEEEDIQVVGTVGDGEAAVSKARQEMPDIILMDIDMPKMNGIRATQSIRQENPVTGIVILTIYHDDANVFQAIKAGAMGYILKDSPPEDTVAAIRAVYRGEAILHPSLVGRVMKEFSRLSQQRAADTAIFSELTGREIEVLKLLAEGKRNREIAEDLFISEKTVKNHVSNIFYKLQVNDRTEAALFAARQGLVNLDENRSEP